MSISPAKPSHHVDNGVIDISNLSIVKTCELDRSIVAHSMQKVVERAQRRPFIVLGNTGPPTRDD